MVFHVGSDSKFSEIYVYDSDSNQIQFIDGKSDNVNIESIFEKIKNSVDGELGNICIFCNGDDTNDIRKNIIKYGIEAGFENVEIIYEAAAIYFSAISETVYKLENSDLICIIHNKSFYIWIKSKEYEEMINVIELHDYKYFDQIIIESSNDKKETSNTKLLFYQNELDLENSISNNLLQNFQCFTYNFEGYAKATLKKSLALTEDPLIEMLNVGSFLDRALEIYVGKQQIIFCDFHQKLPLKEEIELKKFKMTRPLYILSYSNKNEKRIEEALFLPANEKFLLTFKVDKNGIFTINLKKLDKYNTNYHGNPDLYYSRFTLKPMNLLFQEEQRHAKIFGGNLPVKNDIVGIDLGTTRCFGAVVRRDGIEAIALDNQGQRGLPSYVSFDEKNVKCGKLVISRMRNVAKSTVFDAKNIIGKQYNEINKKECWPFKIMNVNNFVQIEVEDCGRKSLKYPEEILAVLLKHIKEEAEKFQGKKLNAAIISCPISFTKSQQDAIYVSAILAGWKSIHLLSDSIAAASKYFVERIIRINTLLLIFDLGGENLNVAIAEFVKNKSHIIHFQGIADVCGRDFDNILFEYLKRKLITKFKIKKLEADYEKKEEKQKILHKLLAKSEEIKEVLSTEKEALLYVDDFDIEQSGFKKIEPQKFEKLSSHLLIKIKEMMVENLEFYNYDPSQINKVLLLGGGSRMPMIKTMIKEMFINAEILQEKHPEEVVALGALYYVRGDKHSYAFSFRGVSRYLHIFL